MICCREVMGLPSIPKQYLLSAEEILQLKLLSPVELTDYGSYLPPQNHVQEFLEPYFESPIQVRYQLILSDRPYHKDICKQSQKYNYVYELGGDSVTTAWMDEKGNCFDIVCSPFTWYLLDVKIPHCVRGMVQPRCSITVKIV